MEICRHSKANVIICTLIFGPCLKEGLTVGGAPIIHGIYGIRQVMHMHHNR